MKLDERQTVMLKGVAIGLLLSYIFFLMWA